MGFPKTLGLVGIAALLGGCGQPPLQGTWELAAPNGGHSVIVFFADGTYSHDVLNGEVFSRGTYRQPGGRLVLNQTSWYSPKPESHKRMLTLPAIETEVDINWKSPDEATISGLGGTKVLRRRT